jgi:Glycosyl transferase family 2
MNELRGVTIIVVNFNNEAFLAQAIESALTQTHPACEVIVADDCFDRWLARRHEVDRFTFYDSQRGPRGSND